MKKAKPIQRARALLVDGNALLRSVTVAQLRDVGIEQVTQASRIADARELLEREPFDLVVCSREFEGSETSGQDLLDELRREQLLSPSTVFIMISGSAAYHHVMEAAESALDGYLVRPYTTEMLSQRLTEARARKRELGEVLRALDAGEPEVALVRAVKRFQEQAPYATWCGRLAAELMLTLHRPDDALLLFQKLVAQRPASWARLGMARAQIARDDLGAAHQTLATLLTDDPGCADAHDLLGRLLVDQCEFDGAMDHYRRAAEITPGCLLRQQHAGALALYQGHHDEALQRLERALALGIKSKLFDALTLHLIATLHFDRGDAKGVSAMRDQLRSFRRRYPESHRLVRLELGVRALHGTATGDAKETTEALQALSAQALEDDFDLEAATLLLGLMQRLNSKAAASDGPQSLVARIGWRFAVSRAIVEVLVAAAGHDGTTAELLRQCHAHVSAEAEQAMNLALQGDASAAVVRLLERGDEWRNARLLELARSLLRRHRGTIADAERLEQQVEALIARVGGPVNHIAGIQRAGRGPGAMVLRGAARTHRSGAAPADPPRTARAEPDPAPAGETA